MKVKSKNRCLVKILIQCGDHFENQKRISILTESLLVSGQKPVVLMYKKGGGNLFKVMGVEVIYLSEYIIKNDLSINFKSKIYDNLTVKDFAEVEILRNPRLGWPSQVKKTSNSVLSHVQAIEKILDVVKPDHVVIWNGFTGFVANTLRVLCQYKELPMSFLERGLLKNSLFIDKKGVNGASTLTSIKNYNEFVDDYLSSYVQKIFFNELGSREANLLEKPEFLEGKKIIFFPLQVQLDTNIVLYCRYKTMREVFFELYQALNDKDVVFVVRPHPEEDEETLINIPNLHNVIISVDHSLGYWLGLSDLVVTINSTVGLESLIQGKPVICLGKSIYSSLQCLSRYDNLIADKNYILSSIAHYLSHLVTHNLLVENGCYNEFVMSNIFGISHAKKIVLNPSKKSMDKGLDFNHRVFCDFSFSTRLNLTYRKSSIPITVDWIDEIFIPLLGSYEFVKKIDDADVVITDKPFEDLCFAKGKLYFDVYGVRLKDGRLQNDFYLY